MKRLFILAPPSPSPALSQMLQAFLDTWEGDSQFLSLQETAPSLKNSPVLFAVDVDVFGYSLEFDRLFLHVLRAQSEDSPSFQNSNLDFHPQAPCLAPSASSPKPLVAPVKNWDVQQNPKILAGSVGALLICSQNDLCTKTTARRIVFQANRLGMAFMGRPLVEATVSGRNFYILQKQTGLSWQDLSRREASSLSSRLAAFRLKSDTPSSLLALHSGGTDSSNTYLLWTMVRHALEGLLSVEEIDVGNGQIKDCKGCPYTVCKYYGQQTSCFYGGIMVTDVYPAMEACDALLLVCPNYNDALSANLCAMINRLTALFRKTKFYDKKLYAIVVSGNSGSDALGEQLISALNMNKTFQLPPAFLLDEIANDRGDILHVPQIEDKATAFARRICEPSWIPENS